MYILWIQRICRSFWLEICMSHISIVHICVLRMSRMCQIFWFWPIYVRDFHYRSCLIVRLLFRLWPLNVVMRNRISYKLGRRNWSCDYIGQLVLRIQRIVILSRGPKFVAIRTRPPDVQVSQIVLRLVEPNMERSRCGSVNIPVLIRVLRSVVKLSRSKLLGFCS